jgi:hypothetical protein
MTTLADVRSRALRALIPPPRLQLSTWIEGNIRLPEGVSALPGPVPLIIAKLDRLARNVHFISGLMESGIDFVAADNPHANKLMVHLLAAFAEHEREQISQRTKDALAAAKTRGIRLGRNGADRLAPTYRTEAVERARQLAPLLTELKGAGMSARRMAAELTTRGIATPSGGRWHAQTVLRMIDRAGSAPHTRQRATPRTVNSS